MKMFSLDRKGQAEASPQSRWIVVPFLLAILTASAFTSHAQAPDQQGLTEKIQKLSDAMASTQAQLEQSRSQLEEMRKELNELRSQMALTGAVANSPALSDSSPDSSSSTQGSPEELASAVRDIREHQAVEESQIATHEQTKVETESRYPIKVTGMLLLNGFVNTRLLIWRQRRP